MTALLLALCLCSLRGADALPLPSGLRWQTLEAAHARVVFPEGLEGLAQEAIVALEELAQSHAPGKKITLVLHDSRDLSELTVDGLSHRMILSVAQSECPAPVESLWQAAVSKGYRSLARESDDQAVLPMVRPWLRLWRALWEHQDEASCALSDPPSLQIPSPDGAQILTLKRDWHQHAYLYGDLYLTDKKTRREERLTEGARVYRAAFFPDGQKILVAQYRWGDRGPVLSVLDRTTKEITLLKEFSLHDYFPHSLAVSPDGKQIALSLWRRGGFQDIYLMALPPPYGPPVGDDRRGAGGEGLQPITRDRIPDFDPAFSADGQFLLFSRREHEFPQRYAYRLADGAFFKVLSDSDWELITLEREPFPSWEGFPETDYPIVPYDPRTTLDPHLWIPLVGLTSIGLATFGEDALGHHRYQFALGFDWRRLEPFYWMRYEDQQFLLGFSALVQKDHTGSQQRASATLPLVTTLAAQHRLSLFYHREERETTAHTIGLVWSGGLAPSLALPRLEFSLTAQTRTRTGQRLWENLLVLEMRATLPLPQHHSLQLSWKSDSWRIGYHLWLRPWLRVELFATSGVRWGAELEFAASQLWSPRLGLTGGATQHLEFYLNFWGD
ncbi:MAG: hypothetical protein NZ610_00115 [Candidatus Bipolaricaulota bacterium]|nr:hypothetical protein [Candidatus Bipolaricaulota bacterium]MCS7273803.1 hypothetical protein [Candidatus Bipolaricaulota bacterium]MDW8110779.1 hypothetical protein [Candidatus Bipolaricaulota bacterium]MDW8328363.1 hypothetical protein [Candidatus Bipolaricaulota bacterium]